MSDIRSNDKQGQYILDAMESISKNGDAYCSDETLYRCCRRMNKSLTLERYRTDKAALLRANDLHIEGLRIYTQRTWAYEESAAGFLADILTDGEVEGAELPASLSCGGITLSAQQRDAVHMALSNRLSIVLGGAGSGKTTLSQTHGRDRLHYPKHQSHCDSHQQCHVRIQVRQCNDHRCPSESQKLHQNGD